MPLRRRSKYGSRRTECDGIVFHSAKEARRYRDLRLLEKAGEIRTLRCQVPYPLLVKGPVEFSVIGRYDADFVYDARDAKGIWREVVEDVKGGPRTRVYAMKRKLMWALHGIRIVEM